MTKYYYVNTALPALSFDHPPDISFAEFEELLKDQLAEKDYKQTRAIRNLYDLLNIRALWKGEPLDPWGNLNEMEIEEALTQQLGFPKYVYTFVETYETKEERLRHFPALLATFFRKAAESQPEGFLKRYFEFEREWRLVFTAFRAKKLGRDLNVELQYENPEEELIAQMLAQKDAKTYEPPEKYEALKTIFDQYGEDPLGLQKALDEYRFNYVTHLVDQEDAFSFDRILAYTIQLMIVRKWLELDQEKGIKIIDSLTSRMKG